MTLRPVQPTAQRQTAISLESHEFRLSQLTQSSNKDRDLLAFARIRLAENGQRGPIEVIAERSDAELDSFEINHRSTTAALFWNVGGRDELAFMDLLTGRMRAKPKLPAEIADELVFSRDDKLLAMTISGSSSPHRYLASRSTQRYLKFSGAANPRERHLRFLFLGSLSSLCSPLGRAGHLISTGPRHDYLVVNARMIAKDRWKPSSSCLAACWLCIPLFRSHCHSRSYTLIDASGTSSISSAIFLTPA